MTDVTARKMAGEKYRLFHLKDLRTPDIRPHYHEFDKIVVLLSGAVEYTVEGYRYRMSPGDLLLVRHHDIHRPVMNSESTYERIILWIEPMWLRPGAVCPSEETPPLDGCFLQASSQQTCLYRPKDSHFSQLKRLLWELEAVEAEDPSSFGNALLSDALFLQLMVEINRLVLQDPGETPQNADRQIAGALKYIHSHLAQPISVDALASSCYLSRYYFMRRFKEATGCTVHSYILKKRLTSAAEQLNEGVGVQEAARSAGFAEYSSFLRAFRKNFGVTPSEYQRHRRSFNEENIE